MGEPLVAGEPVPWETYQAHVREAARTGGAAALEGYAARLTSQADALALLGVGDNAMRVSRQILQRIALDVRERAEEARRG
jgi:hypothetical protein